jgi:hypothetical protein
VLCLPTGTAVSAEQVSLVCEIIRTVVSRGAEVRERISGRRMEFGQGTKPH